MPDARFTAMALAAPALSLRSQIVRPLVRPDLLQLTAVRGWLLAEQVENAPRVAGAPVMVERAVAGADGASYFVPQARVAQRSKVTGAPHVFLAKQDGAVMLQVWFDLVMFASLPTGSAALPVDGISVSLVPPTGEAIVFERCDDLPRGDQPETVLSRLYCETPVDPNRVVSILEAPGARFRVEGDVHFTTQDGGGGGGGGGEGVRVRPDGHLRAFASAVRRFDLSTLAAPAVTRTGFAGARVRDHRTGPVIRDHRVIATPVVPDAPEPRWVSHTARMSLGAADGSGVGASFPRAVMGNRAIYAQVTSGFGAEPWSEWVDSPEGTFMDSPVPDQFYVVPDEYRLAFDAETKQPAMMVLLVPPKPTADATAPQTFGRDYQLRVRFGVVPWIDPARRERLRAEISRHTGVAYPDLLVGGIRSATCALSDVLHGLGSSLVGSEGAASVDGLGFELVLDCTSEFYTTLTHLLVTDGVGAEVVATLVSETESPRTTTVPVKLRLDRPATDVLSTTLVAPPEQAAPSEGSPADPAPSVAPQRLRVSNPLPYAVAVSRTVASLLVTDDTLPSPIAAVRAAAEPSSFRLPPATDAPTTIDIELTAVAPDPSVVFGSAGVAFEGVTIEIDPRQVLARAHDTGASGAVSSTVEVRCYQLEHPESRPPELADVFGLEVEIRRSASAAPVTVFLTIDQPKVDVQVSFSLADIVAGMRPELPAFEWRRRNMSGAGNGEWSGWTSITGRQLFVSPTGM